MDQLDAAGDRTARHLTNRIESVTGGQLAGFIPEIDVVAMWGLRENGAYKTP
jgi:hypothetical protein